MSRSGSASSSMCNGALGHQASCISGTTVVGQQVAALDDADDDDEEANVSAAMARSSVEPERVLSRRPSNGSIRSNMSTSSMFSVTSRMSRIPNAFRSSIVSVKDFMSSSRRPRSRSRLATMMLHQQRHESTSDQPSAPQTIHYTTPASAPFPDNSRLQRRTPSSLGLYTIFSTNNKDRCLPIADPMNGDTNHDSSPAMMQRAYSHKLQLEGDTAVMVNDGQGKAPQPSKGAVGELLFGMDIGSMGFFDGDAVDSSVSSMISGSDDVKSEQCTDATSSNEAIWGRQRAKSCQETSKASSSSSLRRLARGQYASTAALNSHKVSSPPIPPDTITDNDLSATTNKSSSTSNNRQLTTTTEQGFSGGHHKSKRKLVQGNNKGGGGVIDLCHNILVTATLTTLHSKLISECDNLLASTLLSPDGAVKHFPEDQLRILVNDVRKMTDMVEWDTQGDGSKSAIQAFFATVNDKVAQGNALTESITAGGQPTSRKDSKDVMARIASQNQAVASAVKEIITLLKQMVNQSVCQYHKVYERSMVIPCKNHRIEGKNRLGSSAQDYTVDNTRPDYAQANVEYMDEEAYGFRNRFVNKDYITFVGYTKDNDPVLITAICEEQKDDDDKNKPDSMKKRLYHIIIRKKQGQDIRQTIPDSFLLRAPSAETPEKESILDTTWKAVIEPSLDIPFDNMKKIDANTMSTSGLQKDILMLDEQAVHDRYKFGVLYIKEGQTREEEWLSNNHDSKHFDHFLNIIGRKVPLKGYNGWAGGLDTKGGYSGEHTFVNEWNGHNIAYHVSTLIPTHPGDKQQVQRKRHIGNDIVCIVFAEGKQPFNPAAIKSQFLHVFIIVHPEEWKGHIGWRVEIAMAENVPSFGPSLPSENAIFFDEAELCSFMLAKLINAEYAAYQSPKFAQPMARAREGILAHLLERGNKIAQPIELSSPTTTSTSSTSSLARHIKSPSTSSDKSSKSTYSNSSDAVAPAPAPVPSRSSMIKDFSEGIIAAGLGRRRSGQDLSDARLKPARGVVKPKKSKEPDEDTTTTSSQQRSCSELDLIQPSSTAMSGSRSSGAIMQSPSKNERYGFRYKAQSILTSFGGAGRRQQQ